MVGAGSRNRITGGEPRNVSSPPLAVVSTPCDPVQALPSLPLKPWHEYGKDSDAALVLMHEIARDPNQQYSEACRKAKAFLTKFNLWVTA